MAETVYFVTAFSEPAKVRARLFGMFNEGDRFELDGDKWMVAYDGATQDLAEKVGVRGGENWVGTGLVLPVTTYSGRAPTALWDWLRKKKV